jgi:flagellar M-ring protein FliF
MFDNLQRLWAEARPGARAGLLLGTLLIAGCLAWALSAVLRTEYQVLFGELDPADSATIVAELVGQLHALKLGPDETSILVERSQVHATRLKLMGKGVNLRGGVGFEIFSNNDFGMTDFAQRINYQRALQGELTRTISALDEVRQVRVHLVLPESGLFRKSGVKPKAAVTLAMKHGRKIGAQQVLPQ